MVYKNTCPMTRTINEPTNNVFITVCFGALPRSGCEDSTGPSGGPPAWGVNVLVRGSWQQSAPTPGFHRCPVLFPSTCRLWQPGGSVGTSVQEQRLRKFRGTFCIRHRLGKHGERREHGLPNGAAINTLRAPSPLLRALPSSKEETGEEGVKSVTGTGGGGAEGRRRAGGTRGRSGWFLPCRSAETKPRL